MAKFQLCEFKRTRRIANLVLKTQNSGWERGIAKVPDFGTSDVECIIDAEGKVVKKVYDYRLLVGLAYVAIDTEANAIQA